MSLPASESGIRKEYLTKNGKIKASAVVGGGGGCGVTSAQANTLNNLLKQIAYVSPSVSTEYNAFLDAWGLTHVTSITAIYTQTTEIFDTTPLDNLKEDLTVTANYSDGTSTEVSTYTLSGTLTEGTSTITVSYDGKTTTFNVTVSAGGGIPAEYQQCAWIKSTNSLTTETAIYAYIDTELKVNEKTAVEMRVKGEDTSIGKNYFGTNPKFVLTGSGGFYLCRRNGTQIKSQVSVLGEAVVSYSNGDFKINGDTVDTFTDLTTPFESTYTALLLSNRDDTTGNPIPTTTETLYYCKVWEDNTLVADFVPVYRKSDGVIGMYDLIRRRFFANLGTGTFTKGADVN